MSTTRSSIAARGAAAAALSTFVALLSHVAGGGEVPGMIGIVAPLVLSTLVCVALAGRTLSLVRLTLSVAASQFLFHALFVLGTTRSAAPAADAMPHHAHALSPGLEAPVMPSAHLAHAGAGMWIAHALAAVLTVAALYCAESVLSYAVVLKQLILSRLLPMLPAPRALGAAAPMPGAMRDDGAILLPLGVYPTVTAHRGPPVLAAC
ncbi:hypothetical protein PQI23_11700 [Leucobacter sp. USCH14]|uniref:hypothetical protein n=1 Tax=Leucobacter sp. USCH14 TaxID=3024838 RepID=UPI0030A38A49